MDGKALVFHDRSPARGFRANVKGSIDSVISFTKTKLLPHVPEMTIKFTHKAESGIFCMRLPRVYLDRSDWEVAKGGFDTTNNPIAAIAEVRLLRKAVPCLIAVKGGATLTTQVALDG